MRERFPLSKISILLLFVLLLSSSRDGALASITVKKLLPITEIAAGYQSLALTPTNIALVGDGIEVRDRLTGVNLVVQESSPSTLFTDVTTSSGSFIAVGMSESSAVTLRDPSDGAINPDSITVMNEERRTVGLTRLIIVEFSWTGQVTKTTFFESDKPLLPRSIQIFCDQIVVVVDVASDRGHQGFILT
ncbi:MAG: hypothetical protein ACKO29_04115, partial [Actinomycetota bacterium]